MKKNRYITVWDPFVRIFHWLLVASVAVSWITQEQQYNLHLQAGYAALGLICLRLIWGFSGPKYARFSDFLYSPSSLISYLKSMAGHHCKRYTGHNPAGGIMIALLLTSLFIVTLSGIALDGAENWSGPMSGMNLFHYTSQIQTIHLVSSKLLLALIALHLLGVLHASLLHKENLVRAMITGRKREH